MTKPYDVTPSGGPFGARLTGLDLAADLDVETTAAVRAAWLEHLVLAFPDQTLSVEDLEAVTQKFGPFGDDPFIAPMADHPHVIEVRREPDEKASLFAAGWHSDWSFQDAPPAATLLYGVDIPPVGGDTLFADMYAAYERLPDALKARVAGLNAIHSAAMPYAKDGVYGDADGADRSMTIRASDAAKARRAHPIARRHPETGRISLFVNPGYVCGVEGLSDADAFLLLCELYEHATAEENVLRQSWEPGMLVMWDNRCTLHMATGGYEGHRRLLRRTTVRGEPVEAA